MNRSRGRQRRAARAAVGVRSRRRRPLYPVSQEEQAASVNDGYLPVKPTHLAMLCYGMAIDRTFN